MNGSKSKPRVAVVSPFLDKGHGTERIVLEWISRLVEDFEIHVYSQRVKDVDRRTFRSKKVRLSLTPTLRLGFRSATERSLCGNQKRSLKHAFAIKTPRRQSFFAFAN